MRVSGAMTMRLGRSRSPRRTGVKSGWTDMANLLVGVQVWWRRRSSAATGAGSAAFPLSSMRLAHRSGRRSVPASLELGDQVVHRGPPDRSCRPAEREVGVDLNAGLVPIAKQPDEQTALQFAAARPAARR